MHHGVRITDGNTTTTDLRPFVQDYLGEPVPEETLTHPPDGKAKKGNL